MEAYRRALAAGGLSTTRQRIQLGELVLSTHGHFTVDDLADLARKKGIRVGRVTVYRTLALMVEAGLVEERPFERDRMRYEHVVGHGHHDHMVCVNCGQVAEWESPAIEREQRRAADREGFEILHHTHTLFGRCRACAAGARPPGPSRTRPGVPRPAPSRGPGPGGPAAGSR
jgi:Fur family ferric uptake transcriptional regulator